MTPEAAIAPAVTAIGARVRVARSHAPAAAATDAAQAAALTPATEQQRSAAAATVTNLAAAEPGKVDRNDFKAKLAEALRRAIPTPRTEDEAESVMKEGARNASSALQGELHAQSSQAAGPMAAASSPAAEINPASMPAPAAAQLVPEQAGPAPAPVASGSVVPPPVPPAQLDYSSDRASTDRMMAENKVTSEQLQRANEPSFSAAADARQSAEIREAQMPGQFRAEEAGVHDQAHAKASQSIAQGLGDIHGGRTARMAGVSAQQTATRDVDAAERARITQELERIKTQTRADVQVILDDMEKIAGEMFQQGLGRAEKAYGDVFEEEKGGIGTWLTTWGDDWEELIERSLVTAKAAYDAEVSRTIDAVATYVEGKLAEAKRRVEAGRAEVDTFVAGLKGSVAQFGRDASARIAGDFEAMTGEIDQRRDHLVDNLVQQYSDSQKRVSALEQKLREENKSLWQRVYDATVGVIKTIIAFKDMLLNVLSRAAGVIDEIISDPIGFLGNLIAGVKAGFNRFSDNIVEHLKQGLLGWLFGVMEGAGLKLPKEFDFAGILSLILQVLGLTAENVRKRAVAILGAETVERLEQAGGIFVKLVTEGPAALWNMLVEKLGSIKDTILEQIQAWVAKKVIEQGILWLISLFNPVAAFIKACIGIYDLVMFFIERAKQIAALINAIIDTLSVIVSGNIEKMAQAVEDALARGLTFVIGLLASLLHLGGISDTISNIIRAIQKPVNAAIDWVIHKSVALVKGAGKAIGGLFGKKGKEDPIAKDPVKAKKVDDGLRAIDDAEVAYLEDGKISRANAEKVAVAVKRTHPVFTSLSVTGDDTDWKYDYTASPGETHESPHKKKGDEFPLSETEYQKRHSDLEKRIDQYPAKSDDKDHPSNKLRYERYVLEKKQAGETPLTKDQWWSQSRGGRKGGPEHQAIQSKLGARAGMDTEVEFGPRFVDAASSTEIHQIGGLNKRGDPIARERDAILDIVKSPQYQDNKRPIFFHDKATGREILVVDANGVIILKDWGDR